MVMKRGVRQCDEVTVTLLNTGLEGVTRDCGIRHTTNCGAAVIARDRRNLEKMVVKIEDKSMIAV